MAILGETVESFQTAVEVPRDMKGKKNIEEGIVMVRTDLLCAVEVA